MSLLTIVQSHCQVHALNVPTSVIGNQDTTVKQLLGLLNELVEDIVDESKFQAFTQEGTWTMIAGEDQGPISTIAPNGFLWFHNETFFDRTLMRPLYGPMTDSEWQQLKALPNAGPFYKYRIRGDRLLVNPAPAAPFSTIGFEYASSWGVKTSGGAYKDSFTLDTDLFVLPEKVIKRGLRFKWKQIKGLPYQADEESYYGMLNNYIARDATKRAYNMAEPTSQDLKPGVLVPMYRIG